MSYKAKEEKGDNWDLLKLRAGLGWASPGIFNLKHRVCTLGWLKMTLNFLSICLYLLGAGLQAGTTILDYTELEFELRVLHVLGKQYVNWDTSLSPKCLMLCSKMHIHSEGTQRAEVPHRCNVLWARPHCTSRAGVLSLIWSQGGGSV